MLDRLARQLRGLVIIRLLLVVGSSAPWFMVEWAASQSEVVLPTLAREIYAGASPIGIQALLISTFLASVVYALALQRFARYALQQAYVQLTLDLFLVTGLVYTFGGLQSPFSLFYPLIILVVAFFLGQRAVATAFATAALALYTFVMLGIYTEWTWHFTPEADEPQTVFWLIYKLVVALCGFYGIALLGSELARRTRRAELALAQERGHLADLRVIHQDIIHSIASGLITTDLDGVVTSINRMGQEILDQKEEAVRGRSILSIGLFRQELWERVCARCRRGEQIRDEVKIERSGHTAYIGYSLSPLKDAEAEQKGYIVIFQNVSEFRRLQEELRLKDRMAAIGELAAGIAHELGNPLAAISGSAQMLAHSFSGEGSTESLLRIIIKESQRLDRTIKGFLQFARPPRRSPSRFDIARLLADHGTLLANSSELLAHHRLELDLEPESAQVVADPDQISQIFWNLSRNSLRAMPEGGTLRISGRMLDSGGYRLRFQDEGHGMEEEERARLFHPFQSRFDGGTGIGMAIVYRIVEEHEGHLEVESEPGRGTTLTIELPAAQLPKAAEGPPREVRP